jgi:hypothetical protein
MDRHPAAPVRPTRRAALTLSLAAAATGLTAAPATAGRAPRAPETVALPDGIRPEGITSGPGTRYYVGSLADGRIVAGDLLDGSQSVLLPGAPGRQLRGLFLDDRSGLVWAAGNVGAEARVWAVDGATGGLAAEVVVPGAVFLNDLVVTDGLVWVTDSQVDRLTAIPVTSDGSPTDGEPTFLPLTGAWPTGTGGFAANGIRELADGMLVLDHSTAGGLWAVDPATGDTTDIPVHGGPGISGGDGLELDGSTLYVVRGSGQEEVSVLRLESASDGWTARWRGRAEDETLDVPSTATLAGGWLWAVNARFGVASPDTASYWVTRLPAR